MNKIKATWAKVPHSLQQTIISFFACTVLTAVGLPQQTCEMANAILTSTPNPVSVPYTNQ